MRESPAASWFVRLFAGAAIAHIAGNRPYGLDALGIAVLGLGVVAALALLDPDKRAVRVGLSVMVLVTVWLEAPLIGNHWVVAGFVALALLASTFANDWWTWFAPTGRGILLAFYSFAAFAKLNAGFFDPDQSCGLFYANQSLNSWGLPLIPSGGWAVGAAVATTIIELAVPILLVMRRTRIYGVMLGFAFHFLISLDLHQHFYDFTALLFALFTLFLPDDLTGRWEQTVRRHRPSVVALAGSSVFLTAASALPPRSVTVWLTTTGVFFVWIPVGLMLVAAVLKQPVVASPVTLRPSGVAGTLLVALVVFNGLTPYLGIKTGYGFNMYANLHTVDGESNHFVIRRTADLVDVPLATVIETDDPELSGYVDSGYLVPERNLLDALADRPEATITYAVGDRTVTGTGAELGRPLPALTEKFALFRSVDTQDPPRCQATWLPAY